MSIRELHTIMKDSGIGPFRVEKSMGGAFGAVKSGEQTLAGCAHAPYADLIAQALNAVWHEGEAVVEMREQVERQREEIDTHAEELQAYEEWIKCARMLLEQMESNNRIEAVLDACPLT